MKKLFTIDDLMVGFIMAIGYGLGFAVPKAMGWPDWQCAVVCWVLGYVLQEVATRILFSKTVQSNTAYRYTVFGAFVLLFLAAEYAVMSWMGLSASDYLLEQYVYIVGLPILGFAFHMVVRWYRVRKIREQYGDGSQGFVFDDALKKIDLDEVNRQNQPITGAYDTGLAVKTKTGIYVGVKEKISYTIREFPMQSLPWGNAGGKHPNRCRNRRPYSRRNTWGPLPYRWNTKARS